MRNIPFAFVNEETINQINRAGRNRRHNVNALANLAETQVSLRGIMSWSEDQSPGKAAVRMLKAGARRIVLLLEKMMEISGPNSIANLERALRAQDLPQDRRR